MSGETSITVNLIDTGANVSHTPATFSADRSGNNVISFTQAIGTSNELIITNSDIGSTGWAYFENLDSTNFVNIGTTDDTTYFVKLKAGKKFVVPLATAAIYAKADSSEISLRVTIMEE